MATDAIDILDEDGDRSYGSSPASQPSHSEVGEVEPTERMVELQEQAHDRATRENTLRRDQRGSMTTDDYSISEAIERL